MSETPTNWVRHARWQLGEITNGEYADALVAEGESEDDITIQILRRNPDSRMATPRKEEEHG
jgi:hypothetical protein